MLKKELNAHEIGVGQWRMTTRRRWFYRGEHRPATHRCSVEELTQELYKRMPAGPNFQLSPDGKFYVWNGTISVLQDPDPGNQAFIAIAPPQGDIVNFPALVTDEPLTAASADELLDEWMRRMAGRTDDGDTD